MKLLIKAMIIFSTLLICFPLAFGMEQNFSVDGYNIQVFVERTYRGVEAHGQISGGKICESLEIEMDCINNNNEKANITAIVRNAGGAGSRLFRAAKGRRSTNDEWSVKDIFVWCLPDKNPSVTESVTSINVIGKGQRVSELFNLREGLTVFNFRHTGNGHCSIWLKDKNGRDIELIANEIGKFTGSKSVGIKEQDKFLVDVEADSNAKWSIDIMLPSQMSNTPKIKSTIKKVKADTYSPKVKTKSVPAASTKKIKIWEDDNGVVHIEQ